MLRSPVPDLLMRFAPTPYRLISKGAVIETNDLEILDQFDGRYGVTTLAAMVPNLHVRIVRDAAAPDTSDEVQVLEFGPLKVLTIGTGSVLWFDREMHRLFAFVSSQVSARALVEAHLFGTLLSATQGHKALIPKG
jgi:hypothetical protein